tara:strand:- start:29 stop:547 length:519 start_codon:yes stop_codon:yes gene_type:complete
MTNQEQWLIDQYNRNRDIKNHVHDMTDYNRVMLDLEIKNMGKQLDIPFEETKVSPKYWNVPFVNEVEEFNSTFGKPNNYEPTIPERKEWMFVYDFIQEELAEYKEACENGDIVEILDALCDSLMFPLGTVLCYMALRERYGMRIKRSKRQTCLKLAKQKKKLSKQLNRKQQE